MSDTSVVKYENTECTRCGGSGNFSYNFKDGTMCFKCKGSGKQLTKRGAATKAYADSILVKNIEDVAENELFVYIDYFNGKGYKRCTKQDAGVVSYSFNKETNKCDIPNYGYDIINAKGVSVGGISSGMAVRIQPTQEQVDEINAYQDSLTKSGKPRKR